jgi:hypothetical protein
MQRSSRLGPSTVFTLSGTSQASAAFGAQTYQIRIATAGQPAFFRVGDGTPAATTSDALMPANWVDYITVTPGQKVAVLQAGTAGALSVTEIQ